LIDIHSHILPGFDDGAESHQISVEMARRAAEDGVGCMVATPHVIDEDLSGLPEKISSAVELLNADLKRESIGVEVLPGAEIHVSSTLVSQPEALRELSLGFCGKYVLLELPLQEMPRFTEELIFRLLLKGVIPILAHPERNSSIMERPGRLLELVEKGALVQANAGSITGKYGARVKDVVELFLRNGIVHFIASDAHSTRSRAPGLTVALQRARDLVGDDATALVERNPSAVINGTTLDFSAPRKLGRTRKKVFSWLSGRFSS
jgi:protein-tyrosine phosphatase